MGYTVAKKIAIAEIEDLANPPQNYAEKMQAAKYCRALHYSRVAPERLESLVFLLREIKPRLQNGARLLLVQRGRRETDNGWRYWTDVYLTGDANPWRISSKVARAFGYKQRALRYTNEGCLSTYGTPDDLPNQFERLFGFDVRPRFDDIR